MLKEAFEKAGLPTASVAFAAACHDLARLALNRASDPARAVHVWVGMVGGRDFRQALEEFLTAVSAERQGGKHSLVAPSAKIPKGRQSEYRSLGHIDNRSRRYVEKRLLRDLWKAWRGAKSFIPEGQEVLAPATLPDAQREAMPDLPQGQKARVSAAHPDQGAA